MGASRSTGPSPEPGGSFEETELRQLIDRSRMTPSERLEWIERTKREFASLTKPGDPAGRATRSDPK